MESLDNYNKEKITIDIGWANVFAILLLIPTIAVSGVPYYFIWKGNLNFAQFMDHLTPLGAGLNILLILSIGIAGIIFHELIHGLTWSFFTKQGFNAMKFGVLWQMMTPYCHCKEPMKVKHYILGAIMPAIILGILPSVISIITGNLSMLIFGVFFTDAAAGDILIIFRIRKESMEDYVLDHPSQAGCFIFRKNNSNGTSGRPAE
jgi:hypothetical protein